MERLILIKPSQEHKNQAIEFIQEFLDHNSDINGAGGLDRYLEDYDKWLQMLEDYNQGINLPKDYVPSITYFVIRKNDNKIIGMTSIRYYLNDYLLEFGGHIGYGVRPTERRKGYATMILRLAISKCRELNIEKVLLTCDKSNIGSAKSIKKNFGVLENEIMNDNDEIVQRYWIDVKKSLENGIR